MSNIQVKRSRTKFSCLGTFKNLSYYRQDGDSEMAGLEQQLAAQRVELGKREEELMEMRDLLQEAGDEFLAKQDELAAMDAALRDQEVVFTQYRLKMADLQVRMLASSVSRIQHFRSIRIRIHHFRSIIIRILDPGFHFQNAIFKKMSGHFYIFLYLQIALKTLNKDSQVKTIRLS